MAFESMAAMFSSALIGLIMLISGMYRRSRISASQSWQQVEGTIVHSGVERDPGHDSRGYRVLVSYEYAVNGVQYTGSRVGFDQRFYLRKKSAEAVAGKYPVTSRVPVYFDPAKPDDVVLARNYPDSIFLCIGGIVMLLLAVLVLLFPFARHP
jgi:hypothetical protein